MTISGWIIFAIISGVITLFCLLFARFAFDDNCNRMGCFLIALNVILVVALLVGMLFYYNKTESGSRAFKSQESNLNGGLEREIKVYTMDGTLIETFSGKFDMDYDEKRLVFDDENGKRHTIYYSTGTVIVNELGE